MANYLTKEDKENIFTNYGSGVQDTGSVESQVALITHRIKGLSDHLKTNHKDHSCRSALLKLVGQRKRMLSYMQRKDITRYRSLIEKLGLRK
jgi:small subunit ribosomal protein S15